MFLDEFFFLKCHITFEMIKINLYIYRIGIKFVNFSLKSDTQMDKRQQQLILELAKRLKQEKKTRSQSLKVLESAGIISTKGKGNKYYPNLDRALKPA
jgi:hypothetical protein